jgi:hypothetical protein
MARNAKRVAVLAAAVGGLGLISSETHLARGSLLSTLYPSLPIDTIYSDNFSGTTGASVAGNVTPVSTGLDGGSAGATWIGPTAPAGSGAPDAVWQYSGSNTASITSPSGGIATSGSNAGEDASTIANIALPFVPASGFVYDLEATFMVPAVTGTGAGHGLEMAYLWNNGNGHLTANGQAISNNDPVGLILDRDQFSPTTGTTYFDIFEATGTGSDHSFGATTSPATGGPVGTSITVDVLFTSTGATTGTMNWYLNGNPVSGSSVAVSGLTGGISDIQLGDNRITGGMISSFSLTAVPEPTVAGLLVSAAAPLMLRRNRKSGREI